MVEVAAVAGPLKKYHVTTPHGVETVMKLNEADAERLGGTLVDAEPETVELPEPGPARPAAKARAASRNKARSTAPNKGAGGGG